MVPTLAQIAAALMAVVGTAPVAGADVTKEPIPVPSGREIYWQDTVSDTPGAAGLTMRFRFVAPKLAADLGMPDGLHTDELTDEEMAAMSEEEIESHMFIDPSEIVPASPAEVTEGAEEAADAELYSEAEPSTYDAGAEDPVLSDAVWLCENWALPRLATTGPRPAQIVISIAEEPIPFGDFTPDVVQVFESFTLPTDRNACLWEPF